MQIKISIKKEQYCSLLLEEYLAFLKEYKNLSESTRHIYRNHVNAFLSAIFTASLSEGIRYLSAVSIHEYVVNTIRPMNRPGKKHLISSIRSFCRFAFIRDYTETDLSRVIPIIAIPKLQGVPKALPWSDVEKLLAAPNCLTTTGRRDYAIILLLATYGLRIGQVTALRLQDIRWKEGIIRFGASKGGKQLTLPLSASVAEALLEYIEKDRYEVHHQDVFLTVRKPIRPLSKNNNFSTNLHKYYGQAGIQSPVQGSRPIRHAFATKLLEKGTSIKTIADLLGHRWIDTTFIYTKVDIKKLRLLVREWPEVISCIK